MARSGTQEQPTVEEMLVSIRQAIHGENAKKRAPSKSKTPPPPPPVSGSMRQMRVSMKSRSGSNSKQNSVRTHSDNFQKLKKQLHDLDPLLGKQGRKGASEYKARTANGFAGILSGDVKLEEALAKLERAGLGDAQSELSQSSQSLPAETTRVETSRIDIPLAEQGVQQPMTHPDSEPQLRGTESYEDNFDEYEFDQQKHDEPAVEPSFRSEIHHDENATTQAELEDTYYDDEPQQYEDHTPSYIQRAPEPSAPPVAPAPAPPIASAPMAPPPSSYRPSYGYDEPIQQPDRPQPLEPMYQRYAEPAPAERPIEQPTTPQMVQQPLSPAAVPAVPTVKTVSPAVSGHETGLTSPESAREASDMFASLAQTIMHQASTGYRSIDDITKELLHPMLRSWLDENLPGMVERLIREEIERVARGGAR